MSEDPVFSRKIDLVSPFARELGVVCLITRVEHRGTQLLWDDVDSHAHLYRLWLHELFPSVVLLVGYQQVPRLREVATELETLHYILKVNLILVFLDAVFSLVGQEEFYELLLDNVRRHRGEKAYLCVACLDVELK